MDSRELLRALTERAPAEPLLEVCALVREIATAKLAHGTHAEQGDINRLHRMLSRCFNDGTEQSERAARWAWLHGRLLDAVEYEQLLAETLTKAERALTGALRDRVGE